jgi:hypothetical protein
MGLLTDAELRALLVTPQVQKYRQAIDRESAQEKLSKSRPSPEGGPAVRPKQADDDSTSIAEVLNSPLARTIANAFTRGVLGALLGSPRRRRRY